MDKTLVFEADYLASIANNYQAFRAVVDEVVRSAPFNVLSDDHVGDISATIANLDPGLVSEAARLVASGDDASAFEAVSMVAHLLAKRDGPLFDTAARDTSGDEIYKLRRECDGQSVNVNIKDKTEDYRWHEAKNGDRLWRRRELYRLRHLKAARAKKKAANA